jgi:predicted nucleic acid-binding protein
VNQLIYVETSIPSFYFETRPGAQMQAKREWTREWWDAASITETLVTSPAVMAELSRTPEPKRSDCLGLLANLSVLEISTEVRELVRIYVENKLMPDDTEGDALHLALATLHECDILVSWNCRHIANANKTDHIRMINGRLGHETPRLITPLEYLEQLP